MSQQVKKERDYLFDNCKVFLIVLVVMGHFFGPSEDVNWFLYLFKWIIVSFHMPAFIFISGYFSKREVSLKVAIEKLAIPYLVYEVLYYLLYTYVMHKETGLYLLKPKFTLWYLMVLFFWKIITPYVKKIPGYFWIAIFAGIAIGFSKIESNFLSIPRALVFYPYFLAGTCMERGQIEKLRTKKVRWIVASGVMVLTVIVVLTALQGSLSMKVFYGRYNYEYLKQSPLAGVLWRLAAYVIGGGLTCGMLAFLPEQKTCYSYIGKRTMAIYLFHGFTYTYLEYCTTILEEITTIGKTVLLLGGCVAITMIFSWKPFTHFTNSVGSLLTKKERFRN